MRLRLLERVALALHDALSWDARPLTADEREDARSVFGDPIDLEPVRLVTTWIANSPVALGNTIRVGGDGSIERSTLIHELAHVWQFQSSGTSYISDSVIQQLSSLIRTGSRREAYCVKPEDLTAASIADLPVEKQAMVIETYYSLPAARADARYSRLIEGVRGGGQRTMRK